MDSSFTIKPRDSRAAASCTTARRPCAPICRPAQSVRAAEAVPPLRNGQGPSDLTPRGVAIDPQSQE